MSGFGRYCCYKIRRQNRNPDERSAVHFDIRNFVYARYIYSLFKFFSLEGCRITLAPRLETIHTLSRSQYGNLVLKERIVSLSHGEDPEMSIGETGCSKRLIPSDFVPSGDETVYDVPMAQHPLMYSKGCWNTPVMPAEERSRNILFIGNSDPGVYSRLASDGIFRILDRAALWRLMLGGMSPVTVCSSYSQSCREPQGIVMVDSGGDPMPMEQFRQALSAHRFFMCAPGVFMPLCHNLVEALSAGVIPVIQRGYAEMLFPPLTNRQNAIVFEDEADLPVQIQTALQLSENEMKQMSDNALQYYNNYLTPAAVVRKIMDPNVTTIRLLAGQHSLKLRRTAG